ncbi:MAG: chloride channel protein [Deltaproteobacteria bacterium]|nr:chloride channel protein [Candidatus Anaeroferrophillus wilburensis]MBN2889084.1 chloride channel protein [Deltaproteobacteria bacterium]
MTYRTFLTHMQNLVVRLKRRLSVSENYFLIFLAMVIGLLSGLGNLGLRKSIELCHEYIFMTGFDALDIGAGGWRWLLLPLLPMIGGALLIPLEMLFPGQVSGYSLPNFLKAVNLGGGSLKKRNIFIKMIAPAITIGTGGSAGQEGPIVTIGGTLGYTVGQLFSMGAARIKLLIACGVAGGIAATFNAPIAGVFFALEIIMMGQLDLAIFAPIVISSATAVVFTRVVFGEAAFFSVPAFSLGSHLELINYIVMGVIIGFLAVLFIRFFYRVQDFFQQLKLPRWSKPILGGFLVGVIGLVHPQVMGDVYHYMGEVLRQPTLWHVVLPLIFTKMLATSITLGSGGAGGLFAPILFIGTMIGETCGQLGNMLLPGVVVNYDGYAVVAMGAFLSAVTHAPMTAIFLAYELTSKYQIILPAMFATVIGTVIARSLEREGIDTFGLAREGIHLEGGREVNLLRSITVGDIMTSGPIETIPEDMKLKTILQFLPRSRNTTFPVVDKAGLISGILSIQDIRELVYEQGLEELLVAKELATPRVVTVTAGDNLDLALKKIGYRNIDYLPVVAVDNARQIIGMVSRQDIISAYNRSLLGRELQGKTVPDEVA